MNRIDIINGLITKNKYMTYLEIGVRDGSCFNAIKLAAKVGVDPDQGSAANVKLTSDEFFARIFNNTEVKINPTNGGLLNAVNKYDIIFIDGLHHADQVEKDIINALACLNPGGTIVCHDMLPTNKHMQEIPMRPDHNEWTGDVWRSWLKLRATRNDLEMCCIDTDWGTSVIRRGTQELISLPKPVEDITYEEWVINKQKWMNVISVAEFKKRYL